MLLLWLYHHSPESLRQYWSCWTTKRWKTSGSGHRKFLLSNTKRSDLESQLVPLWENWVLHHIHRSKTFWCIVPTPKQDNPAWWTVNASPATLSTCHIDHRVQCYILPNKQHCYSQMLSYFCCKWKKWLHSMMAKNDGNIGMLKPHSLKYKPEPQKTCM